MKPRARQFVLIVTAALAGASCATPPRLAAALSIASSAQLEVRSVRAYATSEGVVVAGQVRRPALSKGPIFGHLHVEARFTDGRSPILVSTHPGSVPIRGARLAHFRVQLPITDEIRIVTIAISHVTRAHADERPGGIPSAKRPGHA